MTLPGWAKLERAAGVLRRRLRPRPIVLMYHRVAEPACDPWGIAVRPGHFEEHMEVLARTGAVTALDALIEDRPRAPRIAITFDDGYADVLRRAAPALARRGLPATVFMIAKRLGGGAPRLWWDSVACALLHAHPLPERLALELDQRSLDLAVPDAGGDDARSWRAEPVGRECSRAPHPRAELYLELYRALAPLEERHRERAAEDLMAWAREAGAPVALDEDQRLMDRGELRELARSGLVSVGAHSVTHPLLSRLDPAARGREIEDSRILLEEALEQEVLDFSFPGGDAGPGTQELVRRAGFRSACTSRRSDVGPGCAPFTIPRLFVRDLDGDDFARWLWSWGHG